MDDASALAAYGGRLIMAVMQFTHFETTGNTRAINVLILSLFRICLSLLYKLNLQQLFRKLILIFFSYSILSYFISLGKLKKAEGLRVLSDLAYK